MKALRNKTPQVQRKIRQALRTWLIYNRFNTNTIVLDFLKLLLNNIEKNLIIGAKGVFKVFKTDKDPKAHTTAKKNNQGPERGKNYCLRHNDQTNDFGILSSQSTEKERVEVEEDGSEPDEVDEEVRFNCLRMCN